MPQELRLIDDCYELTRYLTERVERFPRTHRFTLGGEIAAKCLTVLADLVRAKYSAAGPGKVEALRHVNVELEILRFLLRLANDLKALSHESHRHAIERLHAVGTQVGGWAKAIAAKGTM